MENNIYAFVCGNLHTMVTEKFDKGVVPNIVNCKRCFMMAIQYDIPDNIVLSKPTHKWVEATNDQLEQEATILSHKSQVSFCQAYEYLQLQQRSGILLLTEI